VEVITATTRIRLATAAATAFPEGDVSVKWLRAQARAGKLDVWRIAGKDFTTLEAVERLTEQCRAPSSPQGYTSANDTGGSLNTSSSTVDVRSAQAAARIASERLKKPSADTSGRSTRPSGQVIQIERQSRTS
jgi:hypothetical protein